MISVWQRWYLKKIPPFSQAKKLTYFMKDAALSNCCQAPLLELEDNYTICLNCYDTLEEPEIYELPDLSWKVVFLILLFLLLL